jgi:hypothetical protein
MISKTWRQAEPSRVTGVRRLLIGTSVAIALFSLVAACSHPTAPVPPPTVLITNATCDSGFCRTLFIRVYVVSFRVPQNPWGIEMLGTVVGRTGCLRFPASWRLTISGPDSSGKIDTTYATWTPSDPAGVYLWAGDSASGLSGVGSTAVFVPGTASGWSVTFPSGSGVPAIEPTAPCDS